LFSIALYGYFLRQRFIYSTISREVIVDQFKKLDRFLSPPTANPKVPAAVIDTYAKVKQSMLNQQESHIKQ
jgi:hypothetical protein